MVAAGCIIVFYSCCAYFFGDWRNWKKYLPTMLYVVAANLSYELICYNYPLWTYKPTKLPNHTVAALITAYVVLPSVVLIYLTQFPKKGTLRILLYVSAWVFLSTTIEWCLKNVFSYQNGWNIYWSFFFYAIMFLMLKIHFWRPLFAYVLSIPITLFYIVYFHVPLHLMK